MKRASGLFEIVCSFENLLRAARRAQLGKRYKPETLRFNARLEDELHRLRADLRSGRWRPSPHRHFEIREPKRRWISAAPYRDRVVHHALCNLIEPEIDRRLIFDCWANRRGKGGHRAVLRFQRFSGRHRWALKLDIRKYFASIDHEILKSQFRRTFKDLRLLALMDRIVDDGRVPEPFLAFFPGDDLFTPQGRPKGLPIGNLTSQLWANLYLSPFDHWVKQEIRARAYLRFSDDVIILEDSKEKLMEWKEAIIDSLDALRLVPHGRKSVIRRTAEGVPFLGYVIWPNRIRVRGETVRRFRRRVRSQDPLDTSASTKALRLAAWRGHVELAGSFRRTGRLS